MAQVWCGMLVVTTPSKADRTQLKDVIPGGPAEQAGLGDFDIITSFGGTPVTSVSSFKSAFKQHATRPGVRIPVTYLRDGHANDSHQTYLFVGDPSGKTGWWKRDFYLYDYYYADATHATRWVASQEASGEAGNGQADKASHDELRTREEFYQTQWWKLQPYIYDYQRGGSLYQARSEAEALRQNFSPVDPEEQNRREIWYAKNWWRLDEYVADYWAHGSRGSKWNAEHVVAAEAGRGRSEPAEDEELTKRASWYKTIWWTQPQYLSDYVKGGNAYHALTEEDARYHRFGIIRADELLRREAWYSRHKIPKGPIIPEPAGFLSIRYFWENHYLPLLQQRHTIQYQKAQGQEAWYRTFHEEQEWLKRIANGEYVAPRDPEPVKYTQPETLAEY